MFVLEYKVNASSPAMPEGKTSTAASDVVSEDVCDLKKELVKCGAYKELAFPIDTIRERSGSTVNVDDLVKHELCYLVGALAGVSTPNVNDIKLIPIDDATKSANNSSHNHVDIVYLTDINSRNQLSKLSHLSSTYQTVYLVKPRLEDPFSEHVYVILIGTSTSDIKPSKLIYKLADVIDLALAIYSRMIYCVNLAKTMAHANDSTQPSHVKLPHIHLTPAQEYEFYVDGLVNYYKTVVN